MGFNIGLSAVATANYSYTAATNPSYKRVYLSMEQKRIPITYIENINSDGDDVAGVIVSVFDNEIIIGVTEEHGGDAEVILSIDMADELLTAVKEAL